MKKFVSMVTALTLVLAMGLNVCAANSVSAETNVVESENVSDLEVEELDSSVADEAGNELGTVAGVETTNYAPVATLEVSGTIEDGKTAVITFAVVGVKSGDDVVVLHKGANGWDQRPATAGDGTVTAEFTSFSPVVIFVKANTPQQPAPEQPAPEQPAPEQPAPEQPAPEQPAPEQPAPQQPAAEQPAAGSVSPKTADTSVIFAAGIAVIAVAGLMISKKKFV